jgi:hypothetical protein
MARCDRADAGPADDVPGPCRLPVRQSGEDRQPQHRRRRGSGASEALARRRAARTAGVRPGSRAAGRGRGGQVGRPIRGRGSASAGRARRAICGCRPNRRTLATIEASPLKIEHVRLGRAAKGQPAVGEANDRRNRSQDNELSPRAGRSTRPAPDWARSRRNQSTAHRRRRADSLLQRPVARVTRAWEKIAKPKTSSRCPGASAGIVSRRVARELERCRSARGRWA